MFCFPMRPSITTPWNAASMQPTEWAAEPKHDGRRVVVFVEPHRLVAWNRHGELLRLPTPVKQALLDLKTTAVFDGELVRQTLHVFDGPLLGGDYTDRKLALDVLIPTDGPYLTLVREIEWTTPNEMYRAALTAGHEGIVFKRRSSPYLPGRHADDPTFEWLKMRRKAA